MKTILANKPAGFRVTLAATALSLVTALVYLALYSASRYMSWQAFGIMAAGVVLTAALIAIKQERFAPSALLLGDFLALLFFVYYIYFYISSVVTGIQFSGFSAEFYVTMALFVLSLALSIASVFMRQTEEE